MTRSELNRDIKRLYKAYRGLTSIGIAEADYWAKHEQYKQELARLHRVDTECELLTLTSLKMMITLNHSLRAVPLHHFYLGMKM